MEQWVDLGRNGKRRAHLVCMLSSLGLAACTSQSTKAVDEVAPACATPAPLNKSDAAEPGRYMVTLEEHVSVDDFANRVAARDLTITAKMGRLRMVGVGVTPAALARLRCDPEVQSISPVEPTVAD